MFDKGHVSVSMCYQSSFRHSNTLGTDKKFELLEVSIGADSKQLKMTGFWVQSSFV